MDLRGLVSRAKTVIDKRGGMESVKEDAEELKNIAGSDESLAEKAKDAAEAVKDPGAAGAEDAPPRRPGEGRPGQRQPGEGRKQHHEGGGHPGHQRPGGREAR